MRLEPLTDPAAIEHWFDAPLALLGAVWLLLLIAEFVYGATPLIETGTTTIWIVFVLEFGIRFIVAPRRVVVVRATVVVVGLLIYKALTVGIAY